MDEILYKKVGRRYVPYTQQFNGFPKEGVWLVSKTSGSEYWSGYWIMRLGDLPTVSTFASFARHQDAIASAISNVQNWTSRSPSDMAKEVIKAVALAEEKSDKSSF